MLNLHAIETSINEHYYTVRQAADKLNIGLRSVQHAIERGRLQAEKFQVGDALPIYLISKNQLDIYRLTRKPTRPRKVKVLHDQKSLL